MDRKSHRDRNGRRRGGESIFHRDVHARMYCARECVCSRAFARALALVCVCGAFDLLCVQTAAFLYDTPSRFRAHYNYQHFLFRASDFLRRLPGARSAVCGVLWRTLAFVFALFTPCEDLVRLASRARDGKSK